MVHSAQPSPDKTNQSRSPNGYAHPLLALFLAAALLIFVLMFFSAFRLVLLGLLAAYAVASMLRPLADRLPGPRGLRAVLTAAAFLLIVAGFLALVSLLLVQPIQKQIGHWPEIEKNLDSVLATWGHKLGISQPPALQQVLVQLSDFLFGENIGSAFSKAADVVATLLIVAAFVFIGSMYLLAESPGRLTRPVLALLPPEYRDGVAEALIDLERRLRYWLLGTLASMLLMGIAAWLGYMIIGLDFALVLAIFAAVAEAIPTIGPAVTLLVALLMAGTQGTGQVIGVVVVYAIVQGAESYLLMPLVMRKAVKIPPVVTLFTIVLWGKVLALGGC